MEKGILDIRRGSSTLLAVPVPSFTPTLNCCNVRLGLKIEIYCQLRVWTIINQNHLALEFCLYILTFTRSNICNHSHKSTLTVRTYESTQGRRVRSISSCGEREEKPTPQQLSHRDTEATRREGKRRVRGRGQSFRQSFFNMVGDHTFR